MILSDLLQSVRVSQSNGDLSVPVGGIRMDSRKVNPGDVFAAVKDFYRNGHEYISDAIENGAAAIILSDPPEQPLSVPWVRVHSVVEVLGPLCSAYRGDPSRHMAVVGVTGTNGKTTTCHMLESIFQAEFQLSGFAGTTGVRYGDVDKFTGLTTLEAPELQDILGEMKSAGVQAVALEVSSHGIALKRVQGISFKCAVFTGIGSDHLDFHADQEEYTQTKVNWMLGEAQDGPTHTGLVVPADDVAGREIESEYCGNLLTFGYDESADIYPQALEMTASGTRGRLATPQGALMFVLRVAGRHNIRNAMAAAGAAFIMGIPPIAIVEGLQRYEGAPGRLEPVQCESGFDVFVDYAHTPDALEATVASLRELTSGRLITVFGCGGDRDRSKRGEMGRVAYEGSDIVVVTSDNPRSEDPDLIIGDIVIGIPSSDDTEKVHINVDRAAAITQAIGMAKPGDTVLIAGKGHEQVQIIGTEKIPFDDRKVAQEVLATC